MIAPEKWKWFGMPLHFCLSDRCMWHIATQVGDYIISSVGHLTNSDGELEEINLDHASISMNREIIRSQQDGFSLIARDISYLFAGEDWSYIGQLKVED